MAHARDRKPRESKFHQIGEIGRTTGIAPPRNVPRDSSGLERPEAFFAQSQPSPRNNNNSNSNTTSHRKSVAAPSQKMHSQSQPQPGAAGRRVSELAAGAARGTHRADKFVELGERGRKTGVVRRVGKQDEDGFEDVAEFFAASSSPNKTYSTSHSSSKSINRAKKAQQAAWIEEHDDDEDDNEEDMQMSDSFSQPNSSRRLSHNNNNKNDSSSGTKKGKKGRALDSPLGETDWDALPVPGEDRRRTSKGRTSYGSMPSNDTDDRRGTAGRGGGGGAGRESMGSPLGAGRRGTDKGKGRAARSASSTPPAASDQDQDDEDEFFGDEDQDQPDYGGGGNAPDDEAERRFNQQQGEDDSDDSRDEEDEVSVQLGGVGSETKRNKNARKSQETRESKRPRARSMTGEEGTRRSTRQKVAPVEYWRNERIVYARRQSGVGLGIKSVVRIAKEPALPFNARRGVGTRGRSVKYEENGTRRRDRSESGAEEDGVDDMTDPDGVVWSWEGEAEITRRIAFTAKMVDPRPTYNNKFMFQKIFTELDYLAGGILQIPAGAEKPSKPAKDNSYMFYCIEGAVSVTVHRTRFAIGPGATFFVPRGNSYSITATSNRDVKLFFTQGRRIIEASDGTVRPDVLPLREEEELVEEEEEGENDEEEEEEDDEEEDDEETEE